MGKFTQTEECLVLVGGNRQPAPRMLQSVDANLWGVAPGIVLYQAQCSAHYFSGFLIKTKDPLLGYYVTGFGSGGMNGRIQGNTTFELPTLKCPQVHIVTSTGWNKKSAKRWRNQSGGQCFIPTDHWPAIHTWLEKYLG